ncbi:MAG TPA: hypothetical protein VJ506_02545 [Candidatus Limnocylindrales bacterium]|nr:hypothetical protein [Candidatus Limnocylindrales bacterium]
MLERFPPLAYGPLVAALVLAGQAGAALAGVEPPGGSRLGLSWATLGTTALATAAALAGFLQLRLLDEIQDEATDRLGRPARPLPRGLVTADELRRLALAAAAAGTLIVAALGGPALVCYALALVQIWLLAAPGRRLNLPGGAVGDALGHSLIVPTMLAVGWAASAPLTAHPALALSLVVAWGAGLALEVGRKTVAAGEERLGITTYSGAVGRTGALALVAGCLAVTGGASTALAAIIGAPVMVTVLPLAAVGGVMVGGFAAVAAGGRIGTPALRATVNALVLAALLWPSLLAWVLR